MGKTATGQPMRSAERLLQVMGAFTLEHPSHSIAELSNHLNLAASTVRRLVLTLERYGYLRIDPVTGRYSLHYQLIRLASVAVASFDLIRAATPILDRLSEQSGEAVELTIRSGSNVVVIDSRVSKQQFRLFRPIGTVYPAFRGAAAGKILLAWMDQSKVLGLLPPEGVWKGNVPQSITTRESLLQSLEIVRDKGYATNIEETSADVWVVAAPIRDHTDNVIAALTIPCLASRVPSTERKRLTNLVCEAARELTSLARIEDQKK